MDLRAPTIADAPAVLKVLVAREIADIGVPDYVLGDLLDEWRATELDLTADARVVELDGRIVAYAMVHGPITVATVAPDYEGQGSERACWSGRNSVSASWVAPSTGSGSAPATSAARHCCERQGTSWRAATGGWGSGSRICTITRKRRRTPCDCARSMSSRTPTHPPRDRRRELRRRSGLPPGIAAGVPGGASRRPRPRSGASRVAERGGQIAGFLLARRWTDAHVGYVDILALHPDHQGKGLGTALLAEAFRLFRAAGLDEAQLGVASTNPRPLSVYERLGMTHRFRYDTYERPVVHAGRTATTAEKSPPPTLRNR